VPAAFLAFLQSLPLLVKVLNELVQEVKGIREVQQSKYVQELKADVSTHVDAISRAKTNDDIRKALTALYPLLTKQ
jgi:hypothetical protein